MGYLGMYCATLAAAGQRLFVPPFQFQPAYPAPLSWARVAAPAPGALPRVVVFPRMAEPAPEAPTAAAALPAVVVLLAVAGTATREGSAARTLSKVHRSVGGTLASTKGAAVAAAVVAALFGLIPAAGGLATE